MRSVVATVLLLLSTGLIGSYSCAFAQKNDAPLQSVRPQAKFAATTYDFGQVNEGTVVRAEFAVRNLGDDALQFQRTIASCGCMVVAGTEKPLPAGGEGKIIVAFDSSGFSGSKVKTVTVLTNDPQLPTQVLTLKGSVKNVLSLQPQFFNFGEIVKGTTATRSVTVKSATNGIQFGEIVSAPRGLEVSTSGKGSQEIKLSATLSDSVPLGEFRDRIVLTVDGYREPSISIPIYAFIKGNVRIEPQQISFGLVSKGTLLRRRVKLEQFGKEPLSIGKVSSSSPAFTATVRPGQDKKQFTVEVVLDPSKVTTDIRGNVTIETNTSGSSQLKIPVYAIANTAK